MGGSPRRTWVPRSYDLLGDLAVFEPKGRPGTFFRNMHQWVEINSNLAEITRIIPHAIGNGGETAILGAQRIFQHCRATWLVPRLGWSKTFILGGISWLGLQVSPVGSPYGLQSPGGWVVAGRRHQPAVQGSTTY